MKTEMLPVIGKIITITDSKNPSDIGLSGKIMDETKLTFVIRSKSGLKRITKKNIKFQIFETVVNGTDYVGRPEERIKIKR